RWSKALESLRPRKSLLGRLLDGRDRGYHVERCEERSRNDTSFIPHHLHLYSCFRIDRMLVRRHGRGRKRRCRRRHLDLGRWRRRRERWLGRRRRGGGRIAWHGRQRERRRRGIGRIAWHGRQRERRRRGMGGIGWRRAAR